MKSSAESSVTSQRVSRSGRQWRFVALATLLLVALLVSWFTQRYVGWLMADVNDPIGLRIAWQQQIDEANLTHPAIIHLLPQSCPCSLLTMAHARQLSEQAKHSGLQVYQLQSQYSGLGTSADLAVPADSPGPFVAVTRADGRLTYLGAYSDGLRCNSQTSLVEGFVSGVRPAGPTVLGLDVKPCRCL